MVLAELSRIRWTWQNLAEVADATDIVDIAVETGGQNMAEYGGERQIAVDCGNLVIGLWLLSRWKQVDVRKVSRGCPVTS